MDELKKTLEKVFNGEPPEDMKLRVELMLWVTEAPRDEILVITGAMLRDRGLLTA